MSETELLTAAAELARQLPACNACAPDLAAVARTLYDAADAAERAAWAAAGAPPGAADDPRAPWRQDWRGRAIAPAGAQHPAPAAAPPAPASPER